MTPPQASRALVRNEGYPGNGAAASDAGGGTDPTGGTGAFLSESATTTTGNPTALPPQPPAFFGSTTAAAAAAAAGAATFGLATAVPGPGGNLGAGAVKGTLSATGVSSLLIETLGEDAVVQEAVCALTLCPGGTASVIVGDSEIGVRSLSLSGSGRRRSAVDSVPAAAAGAAGAATTSVRAPGKGLPLGGEKRGLAMRRRRLRDIEAVAFSVPTEGDTDVRGGVTGAQQAAALINKMGDPDGLLPAAEVLGVDVDDVILTNVFFYQGVEVPIVRNEGFPPREDDRTNTAGGDSLDREVVVAVVATTLAVLLAWWSAVLFVFARRRRRRRRAEKEAAEFAAESQDDEELGQRSSSAGKRPPTAAGGNDDNDGGGSGDGDGEQLEPTSVLGSLTPSPKASVDPEAAAADRGIEMGRATKSTGPQSLWDDQMDSTSRGDGERRRRSYSRHVSELYAGNENSDALSDFQGSDSSHVLFNPSDRSQKNNFNPLFDDEGLRSPMAVKGDHHHHHHQRQQQQEGRLLRRPDIESAEVTAIDPPEGGSGSPTAAAAAFSAVFDAAAAAAAAAAVVEGGVQAQSAGPHLESGGGGNEGEAAGEPVSKPRKHSPHAEAESVAPPSGDTSSETAHEGHGATGVPDDQNGALETKTRESSGGEGSTSNGDRQSSLEAAQKATEHYQQKEQEGEQGHIEERGGKEQRQQQQKEDQQEEQKGRENKKEEGEGTGGGKENEIDGAPTHRVALRGTTPQGRHPFPVPDSPRRGRGAANPMGTDSSNELPGLRRGKIVIPAASAGGNGNDTGRGVGHGSGGGSGSSSGGSGQIPLRPAMKSRPLSLPARPARSPPTSDRASALMDTLVRVMGRRRTSTARVGHVKRERSVRPEDEHGLSMSISPIARKAPTAAKRVRFHSLPRDFDRRSTDSHEEDEDKEPRRGRGRSPRSTRGGNISGGDPVVRELGKGSLPQPRLSTTSAAAAESGGWGGEDGKGGGANRSGDGGNESGGGGHRDFIPDGVPRQDEIGEGEVVASSAGPPYHRQNSGESTDSSLASMSLPRSYLKHFSSLPGTLAPPGGEDTSSSTHAPLSPSYSKPFASLQIGSGGGIGPASRGGEETDSSLSVSLSPAYKKHFASLPGSGDGGIGSASRGGEETDSSLSASLSPAYKKHFASLPGSGGESGSGGDVGFSLRGGRGEDETDSSLSSASPSSSIIHHRTTSAADNPRDYAEAAATAAAAAAAKAAATAAATAAREAAAAWKPVWRERSPGGGGLGGGRSPAAARPRRPVSLPDLQGFQRLPDRLPSTWQEMVEAAAREKAARDAVAVARGRKASVPRRRSPAEKAYQQRSSSLPGVTAPAAPRAAELRGERGRVKQSRRGAGSRPVEKGTVNGEGGRDCTVTSGASSSGAAPASAGPAVGDAYRMLFTKRSRSLSGLRLSEAKTASDS